MSLHHRLRELAERLPQGGSLTLTRDGLLELAAGDEGQPEQPPARGDFTIAELAERFHRSASTIRGWCEHGCLEGAYKLNGRDWRIPGAGVDAFLSKQRGEHAVAELDAWRAYADFRDYADVGGGLQTLVVPGEKRATTDPHAAEVLAAKRLNELDAIRAKRQAGALHQLPKQITLSAFTKEHLEKKADAAKVTPRWIKENTHFLSRAAAYFGGKRVLSSITVDEVTRWTGRLLQSRPSGRRSRAMSGGTVRHHLNALSNLFRRAQAEGYVPPGYNPVMAMLEKPTARRQEAKWLEIHDAALLLEAARTHKRAYPLLATFLLTGGRESEVLGLEVSDVSFDRNTVTFRPNEWRRLKTASSFRTVPLWPQLEKILRPYVFAADRPPSHLLFPSYRTGHEAMITDFRKLLDAIAVRAGWKAAEIRSKMFRHSYCAARLQTLDKGAPVSPYTVARELGHGGDSMVKRVYGHLGHVRHRAKVVEYRVTQHRKVLGKRLAAVRRAPPFVTTVVTTRKPAL